MLQWNRLPLSVSIDWMIVNCYLLSNDSLENKNYVAVTLGWNFYYCEKFWYFISFLFWWKFSQYIAWLASKKYFEYLDLLFPQTVKNKRKKFHKGNNSHHAASYSHTQFIFFYVNIFLQSIQLQWKVKDSFDIPCCLQQPCVWRMMRKNAKKVRMALISRTRLLFVQQIIRYYYRFD